MRIPILSHHTADKPSDMYKPFLLLSLHPKTSRVTFVSETLNDTLVIISQYPDILMHLLLFYLLKLFEMPATGMDPLLNNKCRE